jgi:hypothetical protein
MSTANTRKYEKAINNSYQDVNRQLLLQIDH